MDYLYCIELEDGRVKVGRTAAPNERIRAYKGRRQEYVHPTPSRGMRAAESRLVARFQFYKDAGGNEYFYGLSFASLRAWVRVEAFLTLLEESRKWGKVKR